LPFDLFVSRAKTFQAIERGGLFRRSAPITPDAFRAVMADGAPKVRADGDLWFTHPEDHSPWFAARLTPKGSVVLSCSYTNHRFLRNFADAFDIGVRIAEALNASLFEEVRCERVVPSQLDRLLAPDGDYIRLQAGTFKHCLQRLDQDPGGPLEYPLGPIDLVGEYFVLQLTLPGNAPANVPALLKPVSLPSAPTDLAPSHAVVPDPQGTPLTKILLRPDRRLQLWPSHGAGPWSASARSTLATFKALEARYPGPATFNGRGLDSALSAQLDTRVNGLGVDFYQWATTIPDTGEKA
jgi:hypothetical protein